MSRDGLTYHFYTYLTVLGLFVVEHFAVGRFALGNFAVRTLRRKEVLSYGQFTVRIFCRMPFRHTDISSWYRSPYV